MSSNFTGFAELLLYNGLTTHSEMPISEELYLTEILNFCFEKFKDTVPLHEWLVEITDILL